MATDPTPETAYDVNFNAQLNGQTNRDLQGKGQLVVRATEPRFLFRGKRRGIFSFGAKTMEIPLHSDEIWNVTAGGAKVGFTTAQGRSGKAKAPFVFKCASDAEAAAIVGALPHTMDAAFLAGENFFGQLRMVSGNHIGPGSITNLIIIANFAVFVVMGCLGAGWFEVASMMPYLRFGANNAAATTDGEWWRLVSCMFMHYGLVHLLLNVWALFQAGHLVEKLFGRALFTLVYFGSGIIGSLATLLWNGDKIWSAGASGAVFGVYGGLLGYLLREKQGVPKGVFQPMLKSTLVFAGYNLFYGAVHPHIDNAAHIGGLVGGALLGWICALPLDSEVRHRLRGRRAAQGTATLALLAGTVAYFLPRYDYRVSEELAWQDTNQLPVQREKEILQHESTAVLAYAKDHKADALTRWLHDEGLTFYGDWLGKLSQLPLAAERRTSHRRDALRRVLELKVAGYRQLATEVQAGTPSALEHFQLAQQAVTAEATRASQQK